MAEQLAGVALCDLRVLRVRPVAGAVERAAWGSAALRPNAIWFFSRLLGQVLDLSTGEHHLVGGCDDLFVVA